MGENFLATNLVQVESADEADLKIWEEPSQIATYVMGIDTAFGRFELACITDIALKFIAAMRTSLFKSRSTQRAFRKHTRSHGSWRISLEPIPEKPSKGVWINLEISGPGIAVMDELRHLKQLLQSGLMRDAPNIVNVEVFNAVRWYLYQKAGLGGDRLCLQLENQYRQQN